MDDTTYAEKLEERRNLEQLIEAFMIENLLSVEFDSQEQGATREHFDIFNKGSFPKLLYSTATYEKAEAFITGFYCGG